MIDPFFTYIPTSALATQQRTLRLHRHGNPGLYSDLNVIMLITSLKKLALKSELKIFSFKYNAPTYSTMKCG